MSCTRRPTITTSRMLSQRLEVASDGAHSPHDSSGFNDCLSVPPCSMQAEAERWERAGRVAYRKGGKRTFAAIKSNGSFAQEAPVAKS
jgi:hypothetical protein